MAVKNKDELLEALKTLLAENDSNEAIEFLEDITDTIDTYEQSKADETDWKSKYEENDKEWRKRYKDKFFSSEPIGKPDDKPGKPEGTAMTVKDLFIESE